MALLLTVATGAWAQDPDPIDLTPSADGTVWTLSTMPEYDVELEVTYYTDEEVGEMEEAAYTAGVDLTPSADGKTWTLAATPAFDVELEVEYETELALNEETDNSAALTEWDGYEADVTLTRTLKKDGWNTLAVPFNVSSQMLGYLTSTYGMSVKQLASTTLENEGKTLMLTFTDATEMVAGTPYLVKVTTDFDFSAQALPDVVISKELHPVTTTYADFVPVFSPTFLEGGDESVLFVTGGNKLTHPSANGNINGFRAYFRLKGELVSLVRAFHMSFDDNVTGITTVISDEPTTASGTYTLDGRRIEGQPTQKGVYIVNGKKVIK